MAVIASRERYRLTPVEATTAGRLRSKPADSSCAHELRPALGEAVESRAEQHVLADAARGLLLDEILDEAGAGDDRGAEATRALRIMPGRRCQPASGSTSDADGDGAGDACDAAPLDPKKK